MSEAQFSAHLGALRSAATAADHSAAAAAAEAARAGAAREAARAALAAAERAAREEQGRRGEAVRDAEAAWARARSALAFAEQQQSPWAAASKAACADAARAEEELRALLTALAALPGAAGAGAVDLAGGALAERVLAECAAARARAQEEAARAEAAARAADAGADADAAAREEAVRAARAAAATAAEAVAEAVAGEARSASAATRAEAALVRVEEAAAAPNPEAAEARAHSEAAAAGEARTRVLREERAAAEAAEQEWAALDELFGRRGVQAFVYEVAVLELQARAGKFLAVLSDDALRLRLSLAAEDGLVDRALLVRLADGSFAQRSLHQLSGGQWRRLSLALTLALSEAALDRAGARCNLLVLDEVMQHLDAEGCARVGRLLEQLVRRQLAACSTLLVVLQTGVGEGLADIFDQARPSRPPRALLLLRVTSPPHRARAGAGGRGVQEGRRLDRREPRRLPVLTGAPPQVTFADLLVGEGMCIDVGCWAGPRGVRL